jgi:hypothetical protein
MTTQGIQKWTVPATGTYSFTVAGARGGNVWTINGGRGRVISQTNVSLSAGTILHLVVGQHGGNSTNGLYGDSLAAGGGGGSFVYVNSIATNNCILAAGGGGGAAWNSGVASRDGETSTSGSSGTTGTNGSYGGGAGGSGGSGGGAGSGAGAGTSGTNISGGNGGIDNGTGGSGGGGGMGVGGVGATFLGGTAPGTSLGSSSKPGGFGGGGGCTIAEYGGRGGGGGYSGGGGGGGAAQGVGGGGGSYSAYSTGYNNNAGTNNGDGYITITLTSSASGLYAFSSHTFTNASVTGRSGPTLSQCRTAYSGVSWTQDTTNNWLNMTTQGIQLWKVPATGSYQIVCAGAAGGDVNSFGGRGIIIQSTISLTQGDTIKIMVGQMGGKASSSGGGGGTFVATNADSALVVAGGGAGCLGTLSSTISLSDGNSGTNGRNANDNTGTGGTNGGGGTGSSGGWGGGGGGFTGNGTAGSQASGYGYTGLGTSFINGGTGGDSATAAIGGFGGGGGTHGNTGGGGGGGGYSGGGGSGQNTTPNTGGGGGSYSISTITTNGYNTSHGYVTVTYQYIPFSFASDVATAKATIENAGYTLFATPITGALAESIANSSTITATGQYRYGVISNNFRNTNKLYGAFFLDNVLRFTIEWTFTDSTNSLATFFSKTTSGGASYSFKIYNTSGNVTYDGTGTRTWNFSNGMDYAGLSARSILSVDDGIWGASRSGLLDGNSPGPDLSTSQGWGMQNYNGGDSSQSGLYIDSTTISSGTALAYIYF